MDQIKKVFMILRVLANKGTPKSRNRRLHKVELMLWRDKAKRRGVKDYRKIGAKFMLENIKIAIHLGCGVQRLKVKLKKK